MLKFFGVKKDSMYEVDREIKHEDTFHEEVGQLALDILDNEFELVLIAPIAGIDLEDIDIAFSSGVLTIKGFREVPEYFNGNYKQKNIECFWGEFVRNIILPENLDFEHIQATMENNLLVIKIQKLRFSSQNIKINRKNI